MKMNQIGIVLLNYNTSNDVCTAVASIKKYTHISYRICIVDNNSCKKERDKLKTFDFEAVDFLFLDKNGGYGSGNNEGIKYLIDKYDPQYILVMNPDVSIIENNTIDDLIYKLDKYKDNNICGIQPLVWTPRLGMEANRQINIRSVMTYWDCCISSFHVLGTLFSKRKSKLIYRDEMPYVKDLIYEVPSGCFFIVNSNLFRQIGYFDSKTFLYNEEMIIGYKFNQLGYKFLLSVDHKVQHEQGTATGEKQNKVSAFVKKCQKQSLNVYMKDYLNVGRLKVMIVDILIEVNYIGKILKYNLFKQS